MFSLNFELRAVSKAISLGFGYVENKISDSRNLFIFKTISPFLVNFLFLTEKMNMKPTSTNDI